MTMANNNLPRRNLGGQSEPWGRSVDERLERQRGAIDLLQKDVKNSFKGINASVSGIARALAGVQENQADLERIVAEAANHQISADSDPNITDMTITPTVRTSNTISVPTGNNYAAVIVANNGYINPAAANLGYITVTTKVTYTTEDGTSIKGPWTEFYNNAESFYSFGNTYQTGFFVVPGSAVTVTVEISKNNSADQFDAARIDTSLSLFSYKR